MCSMRLFFRAFSCFFVAIGIGRVMWIIEQRQNEKPAPTEDGRRCSAPERVRPWIRGRSRNRRGL